MTALLFASLTLRELVRRRMAGAVVLLTALIVAFTAWGMARLAGAVVDGAPIGIPAERAVAAGIVLVLAFLFSFLIALGSALVAAPALAEGIANGEVLAVLARPVRRAEMVAGRWLGALAALGTYVACAGFLELAVVRGFTGYAPPHPLEAFAYLFGVAAVVTSAAIALATRLAGLAAGTVAALLFGLAWVGGIVQSAGLALGNARLTDAGTIVSLLFPSDALWRGALFSLQPAVFTAAAAATNGAGAVVNPFAVTSPPPGAMLLWSVGWVAAALGAAMLLLRRRDL